jgi:hypothetical protein
MDPIFVDSRLRHSGHANGRGVGKLGTGGLAVLFTWIVLSVMVKLESRATDSDG